MIKNPNIIVAGDSFTEFPYYQYIDKNNIEEFVEQIDGCDDMRPVHINYVMFLIHELYQVHKTNFRIFNVAKGSSGNHVISTYFKKIMDYLERNEPSDKIYTTIQLSGLYRPHSSIYGFLDIIDSYDTWKLDYNENLSYEHIMQSQVSNLKDMVGACKDKSKLKIFPGWGVFAKNDFNFVSQEDEYFFENYVDYVESDEIGITKCTGGIGWKTDKDTDVWYGGISEYAKGVIKNDDYLYREPNDCHPSPYAHYIFYRDWYREYFVSWGLLPKEYKHNIDINKLKQISFIDNGSNSRN